MKRHSKGRYFWCLSLIVLILFALAACGSSTPSTDSSTRITQTTNAQNPTQTPTPTPIPTPTQTIPPTPTPTAGQPPSDSTGWVADGVIGANEYRSSKMVSPKYTLYWKTEGSFVYFAMKVQTTGWVALAISPIQDKTAADLYIGFVSNNTTTLYDDYNISFGSSHIQDINAGGTNDILAFGGKEENGYTTIEFKRKMNTGDVKCDIPIVIGNNNIMWAYGAEDTFVEHLAAGIDTIVVS